MTEKQLRETNDHESEAIQRPSLEQNPNETPTQFADVQAPDVQFVLSTFAMCVAQDFAKGGDTRYKAQGAMVAARHALGVLVALGVMESHTKVIGADGSADNLWLSPAVPPMGTQSTRNATLQG